MIVRVAFIGDSHVACIAQAARSIELERLRPTFFAHVLRRLASLKVSEGQLRTDNENLRQVLRGTSGGADSIDPEQFDLFVLMGMNFELPYNCLWKQYFSRAVTEQATLDQLTSSLAMSILKKLRRITPKPVWLLHAPLGDPTRGFRRPGVLTYARFLELAGEVFPPMGALIVPQPEETRVDDYFTPLEFSRVPLSFVHASGALHSIPEDNHHKNESYGRSIVRDLEARLLNFDPDEDVGRLPRWRPLRRGTVEEEGGAQVLVRLQGGAAVRLNPTAAVIWERCDGRHTEAQIVAELSSLFGAPEAVLSADLCTALEQLVELGALEPEEHPR